MVNVKNVTWKVHSLIFIRLVAKEEEKEALRIQKEQQQELTEADFADPTLDVEEEEFTADVKQNSNLGTLKIC
jgi:hypothetical protein